MPIIELARSLLDIANNLFGLGSAYSAEKREYRDRLTAHLVKVADCLERISNGAHIEDCGELEGYLESLRNLLVGVVPSDRIDSFDALLKRSVHARALVMASEDKEAAQLLRRAAGRFRALSSEVSVG